MSVPSSPLPAIQTTISPITTKPILTRPLLNKDELDGVIQDAVKAQKSWRKTGLEERIGYCEKWLIEFEKQRDVLAQEITEQMGRPIAHSPYEVNGTLSRARHLISISRSCLKDHPLAEPDSNEGKALPAVAGATSAGGELIGGDGGEGKKEEQAPGFKRWIRREPIGVVAIVAPWNYPYLTMINSVIPALLSGNSIILKPSPQTPTPAERLLQIFLSPSVGLPPNIIQVVHLSLDLTAYLAADVRIGFLSFTGSVKAGKELAKAAASGEGFKGVGLELGGKDPAWVREDVDVKWAAAELVDGAMFNSGQSCCGIERIYVHSSIYDEFVRHAVEVVKGYKLGDPMDKTTTLGPVVSVASAERIRKQVDEAVSLGAKALIDESLFPAAKVGTTFVAPQILVDVTHKMDVMMEETFGPVVGIMKVDSDEEALELMNDSPYGLTASVWTNVSNQASADAFELFSNELEAGTVFLNRCDFLDPALAWTGVKNSGRGISLSTFGYDQLTRAKSVHMKIKTA